MIIYSDECVGCPAEIGCFGSSCPQLNVKHCYCDECKDEVENLYYFDGEELCIECVEKRLEKVEG